MRIPKHIQDIMDSPDKSKDIEIKNLKFKIEMDKLIEDSGNKFRAMLTP